MNLSERCVCGTVWEASFLSTKHVATAEDLTADLIAARADRDEWREVHEPHEAKWLSLREATEKARAKQLSKPPSVEPGGA